ncbi:DUF6049 family protein [Cellulomonas sp. HZM]|uniref:DUF6049 family protein n=1 Tax=Cellulomonas sp. HZM TaxID=1454010 RepID=UPI0004932216|nr:DUF6049 family protein [Cellulomonas sp. HZM]
MTSALARRGLAAALALTALALGLTAAPAAAADDPKITVLLTSISPAVLLPGEDLTVHATLRNDGPDELDDVRAVLYINHFRISSRDEVGEWAARSPDDLPRPPSTSQAVEDPLPAGGSTDVTLTVDSVHVGLLDLPDVWGPRGLAVEATAGGRQAGVTRSYVLWYPSESVPQVAVSALVGMTGPAADPRSTGPAPGLASLTAPDGTLGRELQAVGADPGVGLLVDPALVRSAVSAGGQPAQWAASVQAAARGHDTFTLPWSDPDVAAIAHADQDDLLGVAADLSRSSQEVGTGRRTLVWSAAGQDLDQATARAAASVDAAGVLARTPAAGTASTALSTLSTDGGRVDRLVADGTLTALAVDPAAVDPSATTPATVAQRGLAELALMARENDGDPGPALIAPGRDQVVDPEALSALMTAFRSAPWSRVDPVSTLLVGSADQTGTLPRSAVADDELDAATVTSLADARQQAVDFSDVTDDPGVLLDGVDEETLAPLALAWRTDPSGRAALAQAAVEDVVGRTKGLSIARLSDLNVLSATSTVRVAVRNDLAVAATVQLVMQPRKACLRVDPIDLVTVPASSSASIPVTLVATANCDVTVSAFLESQEGARVSDARQFAARVSPKFESVGTYVVGGLLALGLVLGIARTVRRGQSARRGARTEQETGPAPSLPVLGGTPADEAAGQTAAEQPTDERADEPGPDDEAGRP